MVVRERKHMQRMDQCIFSIIRGRGMALRLPAGATARVRPYKLRRYGPVEWAIPGLR